LVLFVVSLLLLLLFGAIGAILGGAPVFKVWNKIFYDILLYKNILIIYYNYFDN